MGRKTRDRPVVFGPLLLVHGPVHAAERPPDPVAQQRGARLMQVITSEGGGEDVVEIGAKVELGCHAIRMTTVKARARQSRNR